MTLAQLPDLRQAQNLVMTPQLRQAIQLLQMSNQDVSAFVAAEIEKNPLLERPDEPGDPSQLWAQQVPIEAQTGGGGNALPANAALERPFTPDYGAMTPSGGSSLRSGTSTFRDDDDFDAAQNVPSGTSLRDHLLAQIHVDFSDPVERLMAVSLVELLDESGYLPADLALARAQLGASPQGFETVIAKLQRLEPAGLFARSLAECLAIQLREKDRLDPAMRALIDNLDLVAKREHKALMKLCAVDADDLADMLRELRALDPKPAVGFGQDIAPPITPDVLLYPQPGSGWRVELNANNLPRVLANERYYADVRATARTKTDKDYLSERWQQANWLVKALHQRATTILKVAAEIVRRQDAFFVYGVQHLRPLVLRDIAQAVEMHESTVSRVTQNKYIATPRGLFELKYFFTNALGTTGGVESVSALAVRERIRELVNGEASDAILSDDGLALLLRREGIDIARRTVAKYREALKIPSSAQRKRDKRQNG